MIYCPLKKRTGRTVPAQRSWVLPMPGGSTMTSQTRPETTAKRTSENTVIGEGSARTRESSGECAAGRGSCKKPEEVDKGIHRAARRRRRSRGRRPPIWEARRFRNSPVPFACCRLAVRALAVLFQFVGSPIENVWFSPLSRLEFMLLKEINQ